MAKKTFDRILDRSLELFNERGEPNVTTNHIADELEISPGNLYYHFRNKDDIIERIFARFEAALDAAMASDSERTPTLEDLFMQLNRIYACIYDYRFLYRDLVDILSRNRKLRIHFGKILRRATAQAIEVLTALNRSGVMRASRAEIQATANNVLLVSTFWLNFSAVRGETDEDAAIRFGIHQAMMLLAPLLRDAERVHLNHLAEQYVPAM